MNKTQVRCSKCYVVKYFEGSNAVKTTSMPNQKTTPLFCSLEMFESKKLKFLLLIKRKEKFPSRQKSSARVQRISYMFLGIQIRGVVVQLPMVVFIIVFFPSYCPERPIWPTIESSYVNWSEVPSVLLHSELRKGFITFGQNLVSHARVVRDHGQRSRRASRGQRQFGHKILFFAGLKLRWLRNQVQVQSNEIFT